MAEDLCVLHFPKKTIAQSVLALEVAFFSTATLEGNNTKPGVEKYWKDKGTSTANQVRCLGRSVGYARHYWIAQKSLDSGCIVFFVSEANIISVFLQNTPVCLMGNNTWKTSCSFQFYTLTLKRVKAEVIACPRSLNSNSIVRWKHFPLPR